MSPSHKEGIITCIPRGDKGEHKLNTQTKRGKNGFWNLSRILDHDELLNL